MQENLPQSVHDSTKEHLRQKRWRRVVTALACIVVFCTTYALIFPALTTTGETYCGKEEHTHTQAECYERVLICGYEDSETKTVHQHTDACYETKSVLVCGKEEQAPHTHSAECYTRESSLSCGLEEGEDHTHNESCYTETETLTCGLTETEGHTHDESCYQEERVLICGQEEIGETETAHQHTDDCYEEKLVCQLEEHEHTLACYSNPEADVESASVWEHTFPQDLGDNWAENVVAVAKSQIGYTESTANYTVLDDGVTMKGYTRYGEWFGDSYGDWCAMFASFCLHYAGVPQSAVPYASGCSNWVEQLKNAELYENAADCFPEPGFLVFFDTDNDGLADHVGIVSEIAEDDETISTIEGNSGNAVATRSYPVSDSRILGYGVLPENPDAAQETDPTVITKTAEIYTDDSYTELAEDETLITLTGVMPEDARVLAYPKQLELDQFVCAYDITILQEDGSSFEPDAEHPISVCIQLPDAEQEEPDELSVCYVPEDGEIEQIPTEHGEDSLSFEAKHFSTYAVLAANTTAVNNLRTLRNAFNNAASGDIIQLTGDIAISNGTNLPLTLSVAGKTVTLDLNGHHITISGNISLFKIQNGSLTIRDSAGDSSGQTGAKEFSYRVMKSAVANSATGATSESTQTYTVKTNGYIAGGSATIVTVSGGNFTLESGLLCDGTGRAIDQSGGTVNLSGGYINGFTKTSSNINNNDGFGGAVRITSGALNLSGTVLCNNKAPNGGAVYNNGGTLSMTGGVISGNTSTRSTTNWNNHSESSTYRCGGGGIYADNASVTAISGGYVTYNTTTDTGYFDGGGGIFLSGDGTTLNFSGGYITGNTAAGGGGIRTSFGSNTIVNMTGGFLSGNTAANAEGGGANFDRSCTATITGGYITNNQCTKGEHWGGGGLFCADGATLNLRSSLITANRAGGFGAGIGGCSTGRLYLYVDRGCAVYDNSACVDSDSPHYAEGGAKEDGDRSRVIKYPAFLQHGNADFFCALKSTVIGTMLGGNAAGWEGTADGRVVSLEKDAVASASELMGLTAHPTNAAKAAAQANAALYINGNYSYTHGGGVMCNGNLIVGVPENITNPAYLAVKGTKQLLKGNKEQSLEGKTFTFQIKDGSGAVVATGSSDENGDITFDSKLQFNDAGTYTYYITEVKPEESDQSIEYDTTQYRLTVTVTKDSGTSLYGDTVVYNCLISNTTLAKSTDGGSTWEPLTASVTDGVLTLPAKSFINTEKETLEIPVKKVWKDESGAEMADPIVESITVILYQDEEELDKQILSKENSWSYTWTKLAPDHTYRVEEEAISGYKVTYETDETGTWIITNQKKSSYVLPETGGSGTLLFTMGGTLLLAGSLLSGYVLRCKRKRRFMR